MNKLEKKIKAKLIMSLIFTFGLILGIPCIIFGAIKGYWVLMGFGCFFAVAGFYGTPISWTFFGITASLRKPYNLIVNEEIYSVQDLAEILMTRPKIVEADIKTLISKGYLEGFVFKNGELQPNAHKKKEQEKAKRMLTKTKCPNCGGFMHREGDVFHCDYCGNSMLAD